jgi:UDP-3-O-[3-hydroxymyristoyl] N-acetylglucosamine deacetylase/3-hydroxyacyl-[acyl-carrier-protein] dehydratase
MTSTSQSTLAQSASLSGSSLHTGEEVTLTLHPAPAGHGRKFRRADLADAPTIDASIENVKMVERATTLGEGAVKVQTVEHVLSALAGLGVDNAIIEMDANEPPIGDGSARPYLELIKKAGIADQGVPRAVFEVTEPIHIETKNGSLMTLVPDAGFRVSCTQVGPEGRFTQFYSTEITPATYEKEIASARTFVFYEDVKPLMDKGLIKGGSLENAVVVRGESVMSKEPVRFKEEFARHKILDIIGDLALLGRPIKGHVIAVKPGHGPNAELTRAVAKLHSQRLAMIPAALTPKGGDVMDINDILKMLPHRYPFVMVDRIVATDGDKFCTGVKNVTINEWYFQGHFPGQPVMPGVLQVEAMAQVGSILLLRNPEYTGKIGYFMSADGVKFRKPVVPGDTLFIEVEVITRKRAVLKARGRCLVNNQVVSEAEMMFGVVGA